ncbi:MAG TPA: hypothetical protein VGM92_12775 [Candidatus Kapabacteria bacterium]
MKFAFVILTIWSASILASCGGSYYNTEREDHKEWVDYSRTNKTTVVSLDTVFRYGMPYALVTKSSWTFGPFIVIIQALNGTDHVDITNPGDRNATQYRIVMDTGIFTAVISGFPTFPFCVNPIVNADLFDTNGTRFNNVIAFCDANPPPNREVNEIRFKHDVKTFSGQVIARSKNSAATFDEGGGIFQGGRQIGRFEKAEIPKEPESKTRCIRYHVYYMDGTACADVSYGTQMSDGVETVVTANDGIENELQRESENGGIQNFIDYLIDQEYL